MKPDRLRTKNVNVRMSEDEVAMLTRLAEEDGVSASDFVRLHIRRTHAARHPAKKAGKK